MMVSTTKEMSQCDRRWKWKMILRVINIVMALLALSCVAWITGYLRQWIREPQGQFDRRYQSDMFILPWMLFTLCLSALWNTANILIPFFYSRTLPLSANIACDGLLILSLFASGVWLVLAATTNIDGIDALDLRLNTPFWDFSGPSSKREAIELLAICTTFFTALFHTPLTISAILAARHHQAHNKHHHITRKDIEHLSIHPALRPSPSPLPYPNPNHPTCAYSATMLCPPPRAVRYKHQASPLGVHVRQDPASQPVYERSEGNGRAHSVPEDKGGLLKEEKKLTREEEKAIDF
ncbi:MAG: hypothetical protein Q9169_000939 [Polycauliona sp. 2 TL-2023]